MSQMKIHKSQLAGLPVFPNDPIDLQSIIEIVVSSALFFICLFLFLMWNEVPVKVFEVNTESLEEDGKFGCNLKISIPMTTHQEFIEDSIHPNGGLGISFFKDTIHKSIYIPYGEKLYLDSLRNEFDVRFPLSTNKFYSYSVQSMPSALFLCPTRDSLTKLWYMRSGKNSKGLWQETYRYLETEATIWQRRHWFDDIIKLTPLPLETPKWSRLEDISQSYIELHLNSVTIESFIIKMDFAGVTEFSIINPKPDIMTMSGIEYSDSAKIALIKKHGLRFHAKFKELENRQQIRLFLVTAIMSGLLITFLVYVILAYFKIRRHFKFKHLIASQESTSIENVDKNESEK